MKSLYIALAFLFTFGGTTMTKADLPQKGWSLETAIFAGGCFWCVEKDLQDLKGVVSVESGYTGGHVDNPTYEQVSAGDTGHVESVKVTFDPNLISYDQLLDAYWHDIDPFDKGGQFCDRGSSYRSVIFYLNDEQKEKAEKSKKSLEDHFQKMIATDIFKATTFYPAEEYHQDYAYKNPIRYNFYRYRCGRDARLKEVWGKK